MIDVKEIWYLVEDEEVLDKNTTLELKPELLEENKKKIRNYCDRLGYFESADFHEGLAVIQKDNKCGYINQKGEEVIPSTYSYADDFHEGLAEVRRNNGREYINQKGEVVISLNDAYDNICCFSEGLAAVQKNHRWGYINQKGEEVISLNSSYCQARDFHEGLAAVFHYELDAYGYINMQNETVISFDYDDVQDFHCGLAAVMQNNQWHYIDKQGKIIFSLEPYADWAYDFHEGLVEVFQPKSSLYGYLNQKGEEVIPFIYDGAAGFYEGLAAVQKGNKWGYINQKGEEVIPFVYDNAADFHEGLAAVLRNSQWVYINQKGEEVISFAHHIYYLCDFHEGIAMICEYDESFGREHKKRTYINKEGQKVISEAAASKMIDALISLTKTHNGLYYDLETEKVIDGTIKTVIAITGKNGQQIIDFDLGIDDVVVREKEQESGKQRIKTMQPSNDDFYR